MTANPPALPRAALGKAGAIIEPAPTATFLSWLDHDPATDGPNYLGYAMLMPPVFLLAMLAIFALAMV